jgi:hypothetical protein
MVIPLLFVEGIHQGFADVFDKGDAVYYYDQHKADFILFDNSLRSYPAAQYILRTYLIDRIEQLRKARCLGMARRFEISVRLNQFGLTLMDTDLELPDYGGIPALPEPEECRLIEYQDDTSQRFLKLNIRL